MLDQLAFVRLQELRQLQARERWRRNETAYYEQFDRAPIDIFIVAAVNRILDHRLWKAKEDRVIPTRSPHDDCRRSGCQAATPMGR